MRPPDRITLDGDILLRRWTSADAVGLHAAVVASFETLHPWMPWAAERPTLDDQASFVEAAIGQWDAGEAYIYGIFGDGVLLGSVGLHTRVGPGAFDIGYWLHVDHTGKGVATRSAGALTEAGLALPGTTRVEIHCDEANTASAAIPQRLGYHLDRIESRTPDAPGEIGRRMIWTTHRA